MRALHRLPGQHLPSSLTQPPPLPAAQLPCRTEMPSWAATTRPPLAGEPPHCACLVHYALSPLLHGMTEVRSSHTHKQEGKACLQALWWEEHRVMLPERTVCVPVVSGLP
jgi:hypothetical protein